jgi:high affinity Mn2+ porin
VTAQRAVDAAEALRCASIMAPWRKRTGWTTLIVGAALASRACAAPAENPETWSIHGQSTVIEQWHGDFHSAYSGTNSLSAEREDKHTATLTLFLGRRLWPGGEIYYDPEITQGTGLSGSVGVAGFPNGEATRAGSTTPEYNTARLFLRQTIGLGGDSEPVSSDKNQLGATQQIERLTLTLGKLSAGDIFDNNSYSHDPRTQFLNWSLMENGAWDYPADVKGYTGGFTAEWKQRARSLRWGIFMEPVEANGRTLDKHVAEAWGQAAEWEERYVAGGHPGAVRAMLFWNRAHMGSYEAALRVPHRGAPDIMLSRSYRSKAGIGLNWEQEIATGLGAFARAGFNDGHAESWAFTEIDRTVSAGLALKGAGWGRADDTVGLAGVVNGASAEHRRYLAAGGYGFIVGDGALHYGAERILEVYYDWKVQRWLALAANVQAIGDPGYNRDRGPLAAFAVRLHGEF